MISNVYSGIYWFFVPALLVSINEKVTSYTYKFFDVSKFTGKLTSLIISVLTNFIFAILITEIIITIDSSFVCPSELTLSLFSKPKCDNSYFLNIHKTILGFNYRELHFQSIILSIFVTVVSPLGRYFTLGFKKALKIKDNTHLIQEYGGIFDSVDCHLVMGFITYMWINSFAVLDEKNMIKFIIKLINSLGESDKLIVIEYLKTILKSN